MFRKIQLALLGLLGFIGVAQAQVPVQYSAQHLDAATGVAAATSAVNAALTLTIPAVAGQYAYVTSLTVGFCNDSTGGSEPNQALTSTNLGGLQIQYGVVTTANACMNAVNYVFPNGLKSAASGTATTIIMQASTSSHAGNTANATFYYGQ